MKNEVNRTFTVKKNKFTNFLNRFCANTPQNTGGGNSHSSTVVTPVWKGSRPTVSRQSTDSQSQDHRNHTPISKALKYAAMILMALTLGVGNAWGADPQDTYYSFTATKSNGQTVAPVSGESNDITVGSNGVISVSSGNSFAGTTYSYALKLGNSTAKGATLDIPGSTTNPAHVFVYCSASNKDIYLERGTTKATANVNSSVPGVVELVTTENGTHNLYGNGDILCFRVVVLYEKNNNIVKTYLAAGDMSLGSSDTWNANLPELLYFKPQDVTVDNTNKKYTFLGGASGIKRTITFTAQSNGSIAIDFVNGSSSKRYGYLYEMKDYKTLESSALAPTSQLSTSGTETLEYASIKAGKTYAITASGADMAVTGIRFTASGGGDCTSPTIEWATEPANGTKGDDDATASVTTTPTPYSVSWTSNNTSVATVSSGTVSYVSPGFARITASLTYSGEDYCEETVSVYKDIKVLIDAITPGANDKLWYYTSAKPSSSPDDGLHFANSKEGSGMYGIKLNSSGYAWFEKPAVSGKLRVGAYASGTDPYVVNVYACDDEGTIVGDVLGTLSTPRAGGVSATMNIDADVEGIKIMRSTSSEGTLYFIEFEADPVVVCGATAPGAISAGALTNGEITLTASGSVETGDTWYWQSSATGEDKTGTSGATKTVNAAGTYYIRSYNTAGNCWSDAESYELTDEDFLAHYAITYNKGAYGTGSISAGDKTEDVDFTLSSEMFTRENYLQVGWATTDGTTRSYMMGGSYTTNAAQIFYPAWAEKETYEFDADNEKTITALKAEGWTFNSDVFDGDPADSECYVNTVGAMNTAGLTAPHGNSMDDNAIAFAKNTDAYALFDLGFVTTVSSVTGTFNVGSGKARTFTIQYLGADGSTVLHSTTVNHPEDSNWGADALNETEVVANVRYIKIKSVAEKSWLVMSTFSVTYGNLIPKYNLSFAAGTGASGSMSTLKYAEGAEVTLPTCTFTAPTGKEFDAWVVTKTVGGASVTVTNGKFTMPAEAVTATATWKDRAKHTDATLSDLTIGGTTVAGFAAGTTSYNVELPFGTFAAPTVAATATDASYVKSVVVTQASSASGDATVVVTAEDGTTTKTYTIHFSVAASKDIELVWATDKQRCDETTPSAVVKSNNAAVSTYINQITFTGGGEEGSSLNVGKNTGNMLTLAAKAGFAIKALSFYGKIESADTKLEYSLDGGSSWNDLASTSGDDACYSDVFTNEEVHTLCMRSAGNKGFWIRNMQLTMIQKCTEKTIAWTTAPASEYEVGKAGYAIAASANDGTVTYAASNAAITVNESTGALTINSLTNDIDLSALVAAGDGVTYCDEGASVVREEIKTYYLVKFDAQNETAVTEVKYYSGDAAIALPSPSYSGYVFQGWFDAAEGGNQITGATITPTASRTVYAQWEATCDGPMITTQSGSRTYFVGREAATLVGEASAAGEGELTYTWYSCDDAERTNPESLAGAPTPSTAVAGTQYYYFTVTEAGCDVVASSDVIVITVEEKDPVCIIKATPTSGTEATADGAYKGDAYFKGRASDYKLNSGNDYVGVELASGYTFLATDKVVLNQVADLGTDDIKKFYVYSEVPADGKTYVTITNASPVKGNNWFDMPAEMVGESALYIGRKDANCNPTVGYLAVYRVMMPELQAISINGRAGELDELAENTFNVTIPFEADLASLTVVPTIARNAAHATTPQAVITNDGAWVLGNNTYRVMDKDGDYTDYNIVLTRDVLKYTVSYNMHGGTPAIDNEMVVAGGKIAAAPADPTREDYIFQGWSLTDGGDIIDIANVTIDEDKVFHAVWASDGGIKLLDGSTVNTTNFITGVTATTVSISGDDYDCVAFGGTVNNVNASNMKNLNSHVTYNATTTQTKIRLSLYNSNGSKRTIYVKGVVEGTDNIVDLAAIELNGNEKKTTEYIEFNNAKNRSIYIFVSSNAGDIKILQVKVMEEGAALKKAGEIGYSLNMNKGRMFGAKDATIAFEGLSYTLNGDYTPLSSEVLKMKSASITFTTTVPVQLSVETKTTDKTYYITRGSAGTENPNTSSTKLNLAVPGTWYITAGSSEVQFTGVSFDYPQVEITENATDAAIIAGADVKVKDGKELTLDDAHTIHDLIVEEGGKVTLNNTLTVENLYLEAQAGASGQVLGATNVTANAVYMDVRFFKGAETLDDAKAGRWYMISAPFDVNLSDGFINPVSGETMTFGQTDGENIFDLFEYDGIKRATTGVTGWKRVQGKMNAGVACLIGFNENQPTTIRLKAASAVGEPESITLGTYEPEGYVDGNQNWNGVANPTLHYTDLNKDVQTYNNEDGENGRKYIGYSASSTSFVVGTAFFVQETGTLTLSAATHGSLRAPKRESERYEACVQIFRQEATEFADQMYVRASETASNEYEQGHDMITWNGTTANTALIWANNYGKRLAIEEAPMVNDKATYNLGIFVPVAGTYRIEVANPSDDATLYLTKNGRIFWNLTMGACELDLAQGQNNEYGLLLRAEAPQVTTGMDEIHSEAGVQKIIIDENVFILRGEQLFDMTGKAVK